MMKTATANRLIRFFAPVLAAGLLAGCDKQPQAAPPASSSAAPPPAPAASANPAFEKLKGKWQRADGGYILEISNVRPGGKLDAGYSNPQPINVSKAEASQDGERTKVFIELRDANYPGCTYALTYNPTTDQLAGVYFQAALQQQFEVIFERVR
jgi:hypothetical protein